jgi:hypothetical protein
MAAIALLSVRVMQGFIYWGGGSRRFIYALQKLDPDAHTWLADKLQGAMPGALFGTDQAIAFRHFWLLTRHHPVQRRRIDRRHGARARADDAPVGAGHDRPFDRAHADLRLAGRHLHRRMDDGVLQSRHGRHADARRQRRLFARQCPAEAQSRALHPVQQFAEFRLCLGQADGNRGLAYQHHF